MAERGKTTQVPSCVPFQKGLMMKPISWLALFLIPVFAVAGCAPVGAVIQSPASTIPPATATLIPILTLTPALTNTDPVAARTPTITPTLVDTLEPEVVRATIEPLLSDPMNCDVPCFLGITPIKTQFGEAKTFFNRLGFIPFEGIDPNSRRDFYTITYESNSSNDTSVTFYPSNDRVANIEVSPRITKQKEGSPREWIAYSPETLIKKYGKPSRVKFGVDLGQVNITINMIMYFDQIDLIALYSGYDRTLRFCPFTFPFDHVRLWMGANPPHPPQFPTVPLEKATSLTMDQFTQLMLGDPKNACFTLNEDAFK